MSISNLMFLTSVVKNWMKMIEKKITCAKSAG